MRGGTTNVPAVVGMAAALEKAVAHLDENYAYIKGMRDHFVERVKNEIPYIVYNGDEVDRLPQNANFSFEFIEGESILMSLDLAGIACYRTSDREGARFDKIQFRSRQHYGRSRLHRGQT